MGLIYSKELNYDSAKYYLSRAIDISDKLGPNAQKQATLESFINLAKIYELEDNKEGELKLLQRSLRYAENYSLSKELSDIYLRLVELNMETKNYNLEYESGMYIFTDKKVDDNFQLDLYTVVD